MRKHLVATLTLLVAGACSRKQPEPQPTPVDVAMQIAQQAQAHMDSIQPGATMGRVTINFVEPTESDYVGLFVAAAGWAKRSVARTVGVLQQSDAPPYFQQASKAAAQKYALRPIELTDYQVVCGQPERQQTSITGQKSVCTMKYVDAVLHFNSIRMRRDSGFVTVGVTKVPTGQSKPETVYNCVTLVRKGAGWDAKRSERVVDYHRCPKP
jgi:hypothetical protein